MKDTAAKAWNGLVSFYLAHKKIIDSILIIVGAIAAVAAVIATGGLALAPLLGALGISAAAAEAISIAVAVTAVVSTVASGVLNLLDTWLEIDDPTFNAWQKGLGIVSTVTNLVYTVGNLYNAVKRIDPQAAAGGRNYASVDDLSPDQLDALQRYSGNNYKNINNSMRGIDTATPENAKTIETLRSVLDKASLSEDMTLYRGTNSIALGELRDLPPGELIGKSFSDPAFLSTSTLDKVASSSTFMEDLHITIEAAKGAHGLNITPISLYPGESEILFAPDTPMLITAAEKIRNILYLTVIIE